MWGLLRRPLRRDELRDLVGEGPEGRRAVELLDLVAERPGLAVSDASVAGGRGRGPGAAARDINVGRILHYGSELLLRGDASAVDESEPRRPLRHRRRPDTARLPLNLYTRCAKCSAGRRVGGNYFTSKRRKLDRADPPKIQLMAQIDATWTRINRGGHLTGCHITLGKIMDRPPFRGGEKSHRVGAPFARAKRRPV